MKKEYFKLNDLEKKFIYKIYKSETNNEWIENLFDSISKKFPIGIIIIYNDNILKGENKIHSILKSIINPRYYDNSEILIPLCFDLNEMKFKVSDAETSNLIRVFRIVDTYAYLDLCDNIKLECNNEKSKYNPIINKLQNISKILYDFEIDYYYSLDETESNIKLLLERLK